MSAAAGRPTSARPAGPRPPSNPSWRDVPPPVPPKSPPPARGSMSPAPPGSWPAPPRPPGPGPSLTRPPPSPASQASQASTSASRSPPVPRSPFDRGPPPVAPVPPYIPYPTRSASTLNPSLRNPASTPSLPIPPTLSSASASGSTSREPVRDPSEGSDSSASATAGGRLSTPRKGFVVRSRARPAPSPRKRKKERDDEWEDVRPALSATLGYLLAPLRLLLLPLHLAVTPVLWHLFNLAVLALLFSLAFYLAHAWLMRALGAVFADTSLPAAVALLPVRALATPGCLLTGIGCHMSFLASPNTTARPFWHMIGGGGEVDVAAVSRGLSREARQARDIFESLTALGDGRMTAGLGHVRIHELGIAVQTGSTLEDRFFIGAELIELADLASDITDEIVTINAMSVNVFSWLFWEFSNLVSLLSLPGAQRPSSRRLGARLDSLIGRLDRELDRLYLSVDGAIPLAARGRDKGWSLLRQLSEVHSGLQAEHDRFPGWQRALDVSRRFFAGGDPSKLTRISRDLELTRATISGIDETSKSLERARIDLMAFRTQVRAFKGSVMGLHLGASEDIGLGPEQEMLILAGVVEELGVAVGRAKRRPVSEGRLIDE